MRPLQLLKSLGKALIHHLANAAGFGLAGEVVTRLGEEAWNEWTRQMDEQQRRDEVAAIVQMAAQEFRRQVVAVIREVAAGQSEPIRLGLSHYLQEVPDRIRHALSRPADQSGRSVPPDLAL